MSREQLHHVCSGPRTDRHSIPFPLVAERTAWNGTAWIRMGPLYSPTCRICGSPCRPRTAGEINRGLKTGGRFYCSKVCTGIGRRKKDCARVCQTCGDPFRGHSHKTPGRENRGQYCSKECYAEWQSSEANRGDNNPAWKGGKPGRGWTSRAEYKDWRTAVYERDDYTCRHCGERGAVLRAHHIKSVAEFPELELYLENGVTLCEKHHRRIHKKRRKEYQLALLH